MSKSIRIKLFSSLMAIFIVGSFSTFALASGESEESLYTRLGVLITLP